MRAALRRRVRPWMLDHLSAATRAHHAHADAERLALLDVASLDDYRVRLARIYGFEAPIAAALITTGALSRDVLHAHLKMRELAHDLAVLGVQVCDLAAAEPLRFDSPAEALGWMWVAHRNVLLHGLIRRELARRLPAAATSYLAIHDGHAGAVLRQLGVALDVHARRVSAADHIVAAAHAAFHAQRLWYSGDVFHPETRRAA